METGEEEGVRREGKMQTEREREREKSKLGENEGEEKREGKRVTCSRPGQ